MKEIIFDNLVIAISDIAIFFEYADEEVLDSDASIEMMEQLSMRLKAMSEDDKKSVSDKFREVSVKYDDEQRKLFVFNLPDALGLE
ncbi:hypothetical protein [Janthinobacterium sp. SUN120]|uniref:hypothetical protein n=1 Tax=Janthinobacterium sp. SUN120 TaxID=3004099 RepID=UPI0025AEF839|nr:hypothetical protein [Janthinobacterium sp. SUN120]MDN2714551.1 hypothetical protein [Janthinobacterium sp. SUN120]